MNEYQKTNINPNQIKVTEDLNISKNCNKSKSFSKF